MKILKKVFKYGDLHFIVRKITHVNGKPWNARELEELTSKCRGVKTGKGRE